MALIISMETSSKTCSVALHNEKGLIAYYNISEERSHSKVITGLIEKLIRENNFSINNIDAIAVSKGPGSYTGLRIGVSTAKGLCYALGKPLIGINTLQAMAFQIDKAVYKNCLFSPMIDARRMEVYTALFDSGNNFITETKAKIIDESSYIDTLISNKVLFFGDGSLKCKSLLAKNKNALFIDNINPTSIAIGYLAQKSYKEEVFEDLAYFEPFYLKDFVSKN
jgi:tRNA threonylcarbamoyladenosine biosynthesis protein TsaB